MSSIEWTEETWNPVSGCTRASAGCDNCYAVTMTHRLEAMGQAKYAGLTVLNGKGKRHFNGVVRCHEDMLTKPLKRKKPTTYFVNSMSDLFHKDVPLEFTVKVRAVMALTPQHTYQTLTKRPERMAEIDGREDMPKLIYQQVSRWLDHLDGDPLGSGRLWHEAHKLAEWRAQGGRWVWPLANEWKGTSVENQETADERIPRLRRCPAAVRFLSLEPLIGPVDMNAAELLCKTWRGGATLGTYIDWVICGGESGPGARPCNVEWIRSIVDQCKAAGVPVFVKQLGKRPYDPGWHGDGTPEGSKMMLNNSKGGDMDEWPEDLRVREYPERSVKQAATQEGGE